MTKNHITTEKIEQFYDDYVERQIKAGINERHISIFEKLIKAGLKKHHTVLEVGCGIGTLTSLLAPFLKNGYLLSMDLSKKSIAEAKKFLGHFKNLTLIHGDFLNYSFHETFDVIVFPDVIEHIPLEFHEKLFQKCTQLLRPKGFIFIHIPNPYYIEWLHIHQPESLQIIDQPIHLSTLLKFTEPHHLIITKYETYSIWFKDGDYQYIILQKKDAFDFTVQKKEKTNIIQRIKRKISFLKFFSF
ncbi:MAG: class I SAM-dependent methyltransferase [Bacteroidales bacterium]|nr:class I SAM-dependent methyltransferase [Bacteroidales bacterium]